MQTLYDLSVKIDEIISTQQLNPYFTKGIISLKSGILLAQVKPDTDSDADEFINLKTAAEEVLGVSLYS